MLLFSLQSVRQDELVSFVVRTSGLLVIKHFQEPDFLAKLFSIVHATVT